MTFLIIVFVVILLLIGISKVLSGLNVENKIVEGTFGKMQEVDDFLPSPEDMLDEYDFSKGVRGKYASRYAEYKKLEKKRLKLVANNEIKHHKH